LKAVLQKRRLDQALNAKEFAVCAGISYSTARVWFRLPGFPCLRGVVFWQDFVQWRTSQNRPANAPAARNGQGSTLGNLPSRAEKILREA
jgi:hypothetical protein